MVGGDTTNLVGLGGCTSDNYETDLDYYCAGGVMRLPTMWLGIFIGGSVSFLFSVLS